MDRIAFFLGDVAAEALPLVFWTTASLGVILLVGVGGLVRRARRSGEIAGDDLAEPAAADTDDPNVPETFDLRLQVAPKADRDAFTEGLREIRRSLRLASPYQIPWFLVLGPSLAGKTTALANSQLDNPLGEPDDVRPGMQWWYYDRALVLDVPGSYVLDESTPTSDRSAWLGLLRLVRRKRSRRGADGVLLVVPAGELLDFDAGDDTAQRNLLWRAEHLRRKLWQAQDRLGMRLPVYVLVTQSDRIDGFGAFLSSVPAGGRRQMVGWSSLHEVDEEYSPSWVEAALESLDEAFAHQQDNLATSDTGGADRLGVVAFRRRVATLRDPLQLFLDQIFVTGALYEPFPLRGLYFAGGSDFPEGPHHPLPDAHPRVHFLDDLLGWKLFYEWSLGRPTAVAVELTGRRRGIFTTLFFLLAVLGPTLLLWGQIRTSQQTDTLVERFLRPATQAAIVSDTPSDAERATRIEIARALVAAGSDVESYRLRSLLLPTSYLSAYGGRVGHAGTETLRRTLLPAVHDVLEGKIAASRQDLSAPTVAAASVIDLASTPEFQALARSERRLDQVEAGADDYNAIVAEDATTNGRRLRFHFASLAATAFGLDWQPPTREARDYWARALRRVRGDLYQPCADEANQLGTRLEATSLQMFDTLYGSRNLLLADLTALGSGIDDLVSTPRSPEQALLAYQAMIETIGTVENHLALPRVQWADSATMNFGPSYDQWLADLRSSCFAGRSAALRARRADEIDQYARTRYATFRATLGRFTTSTTGSLLMRDSDGEPRLRLSDGVEALRSVLQIVVNDYLDNEHDDIELRLPMSGDLLFWNAVPLQQAVELLKRFDDFVAGQDKDTLRLDTMSQSLEQSLAWEVLEKIRRAQDFQTRPDPGRDRQLRQDILDAQVDNLNATGSDLATLLHRLRAIDSRPGTCPRTGGSPYCQLAHVLEKQKWLFLEELGELLAAQDPFGPSWSAITRWDGQSNLAFRAFEQNDEAGLKSYVETQLALVRSMNSDYAGPVIRDFVPATPNDWGYRDRVAYQIWSNISEDLVELDNKTPGNTPTLLTTLVQETLPALDGTTCATADLVTSICPQPRQALDASCQECPDRRGEHPCDLFWVRDREIQTAVAARCDQLAVLRGLDAWTALRDAFVNRLEGKYPFVEPSPPPGVDEALPVDVASFFGAFGPRRDALDGLFAVAERCPRDLGAPLEPAREFLAALDAVETFFTPFLEARAKTPSSQPAFGLQIEFRTNRANEIGGQYILRWRFDVGFDTVAVVPGDAQAQPLWTYGEPVTLALRWALDAPVRPIQPSDEPFASLDGLTVRYRYENAWSLLRLLGDHPTPPLRRPTTGETLPLTLELQVPTVDRTDAASSEGKVTEFDPTYSRVYVRVTLTRPDDREQEMAFPTFPATAPTLPRAILDDPSGDLCATLGSFAASSTASTASTTSSSSGG